MAPKANNLFHFTKSIAHLQGILKDGFYPRYSLEDTNYLNLDFIGYPMTCFCDIPISRLSEHTDFYGEYGIGLTKEWGVRNALAPLIYTTSDSVVTQLATYLMELKLVDSEGTRMPVMNEINSYFFRLIPMIKPISGKMFIAGKVIDKDFYQENEWRYVPKEYKVLFKKDFEENRDAKNKEMELSKIQFLPSDVKYIFVKTDSEIPIIFDFIQNNLGQFPLNEIKILTSRIVSLETIAKDL